MILFAKINLLKSIIFKEFALNNYFNKPFNNISNDSTPPNIRHDTDYPLLQLEKLKTPIKATQNINGNIQFLIFNNQKPSKHNIYKRPQK
jgi:hypothetical protein